ncbi:porin [Magnetospirillum fulvum]|uniref:Porin n=1 Tax=Magnetospirillum fulvum TaxID=1082 RepID=A0A1H6JRX5_MAGFU|nr:porin [Magnetospirillum fulvum]SEH63334.1 porin [Magnetospirillum fulvum]
MKKILFASTALVAVALVGADAAQAADPIKLSVGGFSRWWVVGANQSSSYSDAVNARVGGGNGASGRLNSVGIKGDNEIQFQGSTALDNGLKVGVFVSIEAGGHTDETTDVIDSSYAWVEGGFGKVFVGTLKNGAALLHVSAPDAAGNFSEGGMATGNYAIQRPNAVMGLNQRTGYSASTNTTAIVTDNKAEKLTYVSPAFAGLTLGASYVPNATTEDNRNQGTDRAQAFGVAAGYARTIGPVGVKLSAGAVKSILSAGESLSQYSAGTQLSYAGFTLGGSYQLARNAISNSGNVANPVNNYTTNGIPTGAGTKFDFGGQGYDVGLQYATGPYAISFAYFHSETKGVKSDTSAQYRDHGDDTIDFYQASGKYSLSAGIDLLASVGYAAYESGLYDATAAGSTKDSLKNDGYYGMTGLSLKF